MSDVANATHNNLSRNDNITYNSLALGRVIEVNYCFIIQVGNHIHIIQAKCAKHPFLSA